MIANLYKTKMAQQSTGHGPKLTAKEVIKIYPKKVVSDNGL